MEPPNPLSSDLDHVLSHTSRLWEDFRSQRVFITGGTGFFGTWFLEAFAWANERLGLDAEAVVLTRNPETFRKKAPHLALNPSIRFHVGDVRDFEFAPGCFSYIIHASNEGHFHAEKQNCRSVTENILLAAAHVLEFAVRCGARKLLFASSGTVYGSLPEGVPVSEDYEGKRDPDVPRFAHGEGKHHAELLLAESMAQGLEPKIARCFTFVGPYMAMGEGYAIGNFIRDGMQGETIFVNGDGTPIRSYLYASDLIIWLLTILIEGKACRAYNVGSETEIDIRSLAEMVAECLGGGKRVRIAREPIPGRLPDRYVPSTARARAELGLAQHVSLLQGIRKTISWYGGETQGKEIPASRKGGIHG